MKKMYLSIMASFMSALIYAQEKSAEIDVNINKDGDGGNWYAAPWVWIVGAALLILLIVALSSGGRSRRTTTTGDKVTVTKTVERDTDPDVV